MIKPITRKEYNELRRWLKDTSKQASTHDPDIIKWLKNAVDRINILERQVEVLKAPAYRVVRSSNIGHQVGIYAQRVRKVK